MSENIPDFVSDRISLIQQRTGVNREEIVADYNRQLNDPWIQNDEQFGTLDDRQKYTIMVIWNSYLNRAPVKTTNIIVAALGGVRITQAGKKQGEAMLLVKTNEGYKLRRLVFLEDAIGSLKELVQFAGYKVKIGEFSAGGDFVADNRAVFDDPISTGLTASKLFEMIGAKRVPKLLDASKYPSRKNDAGYVDSTDWRIVRGLVYSYYRGPRKKNPDIEMGVYNIIDMSLSTETVVTKDGQTKRPGFTIWCAPELVIWARDSEIELAGPISLDKTSAEPSMNGYVVNPIHAKMIAE